MTRGLACADGHQAEGHRLVRRVRGRRERAELSSVVEVIAGDAFAEIPKLAGTFDLIFLDAWKPDYQRFFELTFPGSSPAASSSLTTS